MTRSDIRPEGAAVATVDEFFAGRDEARRLFDAVFDTVAGFGAVDIRVTRSQVAFRRRRNFAIVWVPDMYLGKADAPLVLTVALHRRDSSPRWKEVVEPAPGRFTHHLEVRDPAEIDDEVRRWLYDAWAAAG